MSAALRKLVAQGYRAANLRRQVNSVAGSTTTSLEEVVREAWKRGYETHVSFPRR